MEVTALFGLSQHATSFLISVSSTVLCCGPHHICSELAGYSAVAVRPDMLRFVSTDWQSSVFGEHCTDRGQLVPNEL